MGVSEEIQPRLESAIGNRYDVIGPIGRGGMASVYLARHRVHGGFCAVKVLADHLAKQPPLVKSFLTEARASAKLDEHPNIVNIVDIDEHAGLYYMIMKYIEGEDLSTYLQRKKRLPWKQAAYIAAEVAEALAFSHEHGVIHRDLKPSNIRLNRRGGIIVMDFGIAKVGQMPSSFTEMGTRAGTPHYMAPEQIKGEGVDQRADLYALGVILYQMVTGVRPFDGGSPAEVWQGHISVEPTPPQQLEPSIPDPLNHIILTLLAKDLDKRYDSAARVVRHLRTLDLAGVKATLDPVDQIDLEAFRHKTLAEMTSPLAAVSPAITETGQTSGPAVVEAEPEEAAQEEAAEHTALEEPAAPAEPTPTPTPTPVDATPTPAPAPPPEPPAPAPVAAARVAPSKPVEPEPLPAPVGEKPVAAPEPAHLPPLPPPAPRPAPELFSQPEEPTGRNPLMVVLAAAAVAIVAIGAFLVFGGRSERSAPPPAPIVEEAPQPEPAAEEPAAEETVAAPAEEAPAPAPKPAAPAKPAPPRTGAVYFRTEPPGARIQVANRPDWVCDSPCWMESLTPGQHTITARMEGFRVAIEKIEVTAGGRDQLQLNLQQDLISTMIASTPPGAEIYIDGEKRPEKTNAKIQLKAGTYQIKVVLPGGAQGEQVLVVSDSQMPYANFVLQAQ